MKKLLAALIVVFLAPLARAQQTNSPNTPDSPALRPAAASEAGSDARSQKGVWKPIAAVLGGVRLPDSAVKAITLKVTDMHYQITIEGERDADKGTYTLDTTTTPRRMTLKSTEGPNRGKTILAIYEMKDAVSMRVCYDLSGKDFPKEFKAPEGTELYLAGYRRQPDPPADSSRP